MDPDKRLAALRKEFPQLEGRIYFNHAASSPLPTSVLDACIEGVKLSAEYSLGGALKQKWVDVKDETRRMAADLIGAEPGNIAFVPSTSVALSLVSLAIPWREGDNVVTAAVENPATVVPWQNLQHLGVEVRYLPADKDDLVDLSALPRLVDERTRLVALSLVQYPTGQRLDLGRVVEFCRPRGILVSADAVQAAGAVPIDVAALGVNFLSAGAQKWLMGPRNVGILYADDAALGMIRSPIVTESNVRNIKAEEEEPTTGSPELSIHDGALKLEPVPYNNFSGVFGLRQTLRNIDSIGKETVYQRVRTVTDELVEGLGDLDGRVVSPRGDGEWSGVVSFALGRADPKTVAAMLLERGVYIAVRKGRLRISPHYYHTSEDVAAFLSALRAALARSS